MQTRKLSGSWFETAGRTRKGVEKGPFSEVVGRTPSVTKRSHRSVGGRGFGSVWGWGRLPRPDSFVRRRTSQGY